MNRRGFTLIELVVIIAVAMIMVALATGPMLKAQRRANVDKTAGEIIAASEEARLLARRFAGNGTVYGVRIKDQQGLRPEVAVVTAVGGTPQLVTDSNNQPIHQVGLPTSAIVMVGDTDLRSTSGSTLLWWFRPGTGTVMADPNRPYLAGGVGLAELDAPSPHGRAANTITPGTQLWSAQGDDSHPGLWVRDTANSYGVALAVYPTGIASKHRLKDMPQ